MSNSKRHKEKQRRRAKQKHLERNMMRPKRLPASMRKVGKEGEHL